MIPIDEIGQVLRPDLKDEFYLALTGAEGYKDALLARSIRGLGYLLRKKIIHEGHTSHFNPCYIQIRSPHPKLLEDVRDLHAKTMEGHILHEIRWRLVEHKELLGVYPSAFELVKEPESDDTVIQMDHGYCRDSRMAKDIVRWKGPGRMVDVFRSRCEVKCNPTRDEPLMGFPTAPVSELGVDLYAYFRGWKGECGTKPWVTRISLEYNNKEFVDQVPAFYFHILEDLPDLLNAPIAGRKEKLEADAKARVKKMRRMRNQEAAERKTRKAQIETFFKI